MQDIMTLRELKAAFNEIHEDDLDKPAFIFDSGEREIYGVDKCTLMSELPIRVRHEVEDRLDFDAYLIVF
jgi:hypothetical protein